MKRFYKTAAAAPAGEGGYRIALDGRPVKTPGKAPLTLPNRALAEAVAAEWNAQGERVVPRAMPLMSLACTAIDLIASRRAEAVADLAAFAGTDLLCYRVEEPAELARRQAETWQPLLDWAALSFDAPLAVTVGILHRPQSDMALAALERAVAAHDDLELAALATAVHAAGSLVVALALSHGRLDAAAAFEAAELEASFQMEVWGEDAEAAARRANLKAELEAAERFLALLRTRN